MHELKILLADDMGHERLVIETRLTAELEGFIKLHFVHKDSAEAAVESARADEFDIAILDIDFSQSEKSGGMTGLEASKAIKAFRPEMYTVVVSSHEDRALMDAAVTQYSVDWYQRRSNISFPELAWQCKQALLSRLHRNCELLPARYHFLTASPKVGEVLRRVDRVKTDQNTLIYGETGTGKELIAQRIHANAVLLTRNSRRPLKILDCMSLSAEIFESEIFGHKKGAFTGALYEKRGALEVANGGDLFLDEIHNIPLGLQQKLLRVLNDGVYFQMGSNTPQKSTFRLIAATNVPIEESIKNNRLLPDFVARIDSIRINLIPLRERKDDIRPLLKRFMEPYKALDKEFTPEALDYLCGLPWEANIRELRGFLEMAVDEVKIPFITAEHLEAIWKKRQGVQVDATPCAEPSIPLESMVHDCVARKIPLEEVIRRVERSYLEQSAVSFESVRAMADSLGISRGKLTQRLKQFGIQSPGLE
jgi:DNA-binding NtrC family response regulator